jgi:hypothetical protein
MDVLAAIEPMQQPGQVRPFGEPGELPARAETDVDDPLHTVLRQEGEEAFGRLLREPDGVEVHVAGYRLWAIGYQSSLMYGNPFFRPPIFDSQKLITDSR